MICEASILTDGRDPNRLDISLLCICFPMICIKICILYAISLHRIVPIDRLPLETVGMVTEICDHIQLCLARSYSLGSFFLLFFVAKKR